MFLSITGKVILLERLQSNELNQLRNCIYTGNELSTDLVFFIVATFPIYDNTGESKNNNKKTEHNYV